MLHVLAIFSDCPITCILHNQQATTEMGGSKHEAL
jgi:hypothetical protein